MQAPTAEDLLLSTIQQAVAAGGSYDPGPVTPLNINDVLAGSDWASLLNSQNSSPLPLSDNQPWRITQILSGTYAESILQTQLANQGQTPGSFVSPAPPFEQLFNPNATSLAEASLLASRSPNRQLLEAYELQFWLANTPIIGSVATWENPNSNWFDKGVAVLNVLPLASALGKELGVVSKLGGELGGASKLAGNLTEFEELGSLSAELDVGLRQDNLDVLKEAKDAGLRVSVKGPEGWTQMERRALREYGKVYNQSKDFKQAGNAFHRVLGVASDGITGPDRISFNFAHEIKTRTGVPGLQNFTKALEQAEGHALIGNYDGALATVYDVTNRIKYVVLRQ